MFQLSNTLDAAVTLSLSSAFPGGWIEFIVDTVWFFMLDDESLR